MPSFLGRINYVYWIELLIILSIVVIVSFVFHALGLFNKKKA